METKMGDEVIQRCQLSGPAIRHQSAPIHHLCSISGSVLLSEAGVIERNDGKGERAGR